MSTRTTRLGRGLVLLAALGLTLWMGSWGYHHALAPLSPRESSATTGPGCPPEDQVVRKFQKRNETTVSVYNAGTRVGAAQDALKRLKRLGFQAGAIGNAPAKVKVRRVEVHAASAQDPAARLVAANLGKNVRIVVTTDDYGPGVDVVIGNQFTAPIKNGPRGVKLPKPEVSCG